MAYGPCTVAFKASILPSLKLVSGREKTMGTTHGQQAGTDSTAQHLLQGAEGGLH